jgi:hypothetical protein
MRIIVACAGPQTKWGYYMGIRSHFVQTGPQREPLLNRTIRQVGACSDDIHITCPLGEARYYSRPGCVTHEVAGKSEFDSTRALWNENGPTALMLGDVFFSDLAIRKIFGLATQRRYMAFGRHGGSKVTGTPYGELFAHTFWPEQIPMLDEHLQIVERARAEQNILRPHGWMLLRSIQGDRLNRHIVRAPYFQEINDWTDDIDFPEDYHRHPATRYNV